MPWLTPQGGRWQYVALLILGAFVARRVYKWRISILEREGRETNAFAWSVGTFLAFLVIGWFAHPVMGVLGFLFQGLAWLAGNVAGDRVSARVLAALAFVRRISIHQEASWTSGARRPALPSSPTMTISV